MPCILAQIATDYGNDESLTSLLNTMDIYMLIVANPDGYAYTHTSVCRKHSMETWWICKTCYIFVFPVIPMTMLFLCCVYQ